jgi:hypothetical protein
MMLTSLLIVIAAGRIVKNAEEEEGNTNVLARVDADADAEAYAEEQPDEGNPFAAGSDPAENPFAASDDAEDDDGDNDDVNPFAPETVPAETPEDLAPTDRMCCCDAREPQKYLCLQPGEVGSKVLTPVALSQTKKKNGRTDLVAPAGTKVHQVKRTLKVTSHVHGECHKGGSATIFAEAKDKPEDITEVQWEIEGARWSKYTPTTVVKKRYSTKESLIILNDDVVYRPVGDKDLRGRKTEIKEDFGEGKPYCVRWVEVPQVEIRSKKRMSKGKITVVDNGAYAANDPWSRAREAVRAQRNSTGGLPDWATTVEAARAAAPPWTATTKCEIQKTCIEWAFGSACGFSELSGVLYKRVGRKGKCDEPAPEKKECPRKESFFRKKTGWLGKGGWKFCDCTESAGLSAASTWRDFKKSKCVV